MSDAVAKGEAKTVAPNPPSDPAGPWGAATPPVILGVEGQPISSKEETEKKKPMLGIVLPMPTNGNPSSPVSYDVLNKVLGKNFQSVGDLLGSLNGNQKLLAAAIGDMDERITKLQENMQKISEIIMKLAGTDDQNNNKEENKDGQSTTE